MNGSLQIKNNIYQAVIYVYDENGKRKQLWRSTGIPATPNNRQEAEKKLAEIKAKIEDEIKAKTSIHGRDIPIVEYINIWLEEAKKKYDAITYEGYKSYVVKHIRPYFSELKLSLHKITPKHIEDYYNIKSVSGRLDGKGGLSRRSIELHKTVLNLMFSDAMKSPYNLKVNPCQSAKIPKTAAKNTNSTTFYRPEQCKTLLQSTAGTPLHDMIYLTFIYGLRRSELMGLKWSAVDFERKTVLICHTVVLHNDVVVSKDSTKTKSSYRTYPILDDILPILSRLKENQDENRTKFGKCYKNSGYVFVKEDGSPYYPSYPSHELMKVLKKYDLPYIRWHDLRHSCASMLLDIGWSMKDIADWLGHADIQTTMNFYAHIDMKHKRELADKLSGVLS